MHWLGRTKQRLALLNASLALVNLPLYLSGREGISAMHAHPELMKDPTQLERVLKHWCSPFNGMAVISNRESPLHRDPQTRVEWYDLLATLGHYEGAKLQLPGLGLTMDYRAGTMAFFSRKLLRHRVSAAKRDRLCLAYYMRDNIQERLGLSATSWCTLDSLQ